jgi:imidazolonepropionase-like amidohydrolase
MLLADASRPPCRPAPVLALVSLALLLACGSSAADGKQAAAPASVTGGAPALALVNARIYPSPGAAPIARGVVVVSGGKITAVGADGAVEIPAGADTIDCAGATVVAGFWNSHIHLTEPKWLGADKLPPAQLTAQLEAMLTRHGFTSAVDLGSLPDNTAALRRRIDAGEVLGPRILTGGVPLYPPDGIPYYVREAVDPSILKLLPQPTTPEAAAKQVAQNVEGGADIIKLFVVSWIARGKTKPMPLPIVEAAAAEAHRRGKLVFAHPSTTEGVELVLKGKVDVLAHSIEDPQNWTAALVERLVAAKVSLVPTLTLFCGEPACDEILREVKSFADAGGQVLFGTDVGFLPDYDPTREYELLSRAGLSFQQILASLTSAPAERLGFGARAGKIEAGMDADLAILDGDPAADAKVFARVRATVRGGRVTYRAAAR